MIRIFFILFIFLNIFPLYSGVQGYVRSSKIDNQKNINNVQSNRSTVNKIQKNDVKKIRNSNNLVIKSDNKSRTAIIRKSNTSLKTQNIKSVFRNKVRTAKVPIINSSRTAITPIAKSSVFGTGYNGCRDAYFTCMDQFCAKKDEKYRRCVCSNKLKEIQEKEFALFQTSEHLQDFHNLNLDVISKTKNEVKAMVSASAGEKALEKTKDTSASASKLEDITSTLNSTKKNSLSNKDTLDFIENLTGDFGDDELGFSMKSDIMNLSGDKLYNAVHMQCLNFVKNRCNNQATVNMVTSAYGMNIENDCSNILVNMDKKIIEAERQVKKTEKEVNDERTKLYKSQNATAVNECIAQVRKDITDEKVCGKDYIHCLDFTGRYLDFKTGEPIYTPNFAEFINYLDLTGDFIKNSANALVVSSMNSKRDYAERGLSTCRDISNDVWNEFLKQSITEIYQQNNQRIDKVKSECLDIINNCLDTQTGNLKDFANIKDKSIFGMNIETAEKLCKSKIDTCQNIYALRTLGNQADCTVNKDCKWENNKCVCDKTKITQVEDYIEKIGSQKIVKECKTLLEDFVNKICEVPPSDKEHKSPYGCRSFPPGNSYSLNLEKSLNIETDEEEKKYYKYFHLSNIANSVYTPICDKEGTDYTTKIFVSVGDYFNYNPTKNIKSIKYGSNSCEFEILNNYNKDFVLIDYNNNNITDKCYKNPVVNSKYAKFMSKKPELKKDYKYASDGESNNKIVPLNTPFLGFVGSIYQKIAIRASEVCVRPSINLEKSLLPSEVNQEVINIASDVIAKIKIMLKKECEEKYKGLWQDFQVESKLNIPGYTIEGKTLNSSFYTDTNTNTEWLGCVKKE